MRRFRFKAKFLLFIPLALLMIGLVGWVVMSLWNAILVPVLHAGVLGYWQALGLLLLSKILFGGFRGGGGRFGRRHGWGEKMKEKFEKMTPEEKEKFRAEWSNRCSRWGKPPVSDSAAAE